MKRFLRLLSVLLLAGKARLGLLLVLSAVGGVISALPAWALGNLVNAISSPGQSLLGPIAVLTLVAVGSGIGGHVEGLVGLDLNGRIAVRMQEQIAHSLLAPTGIEHLVAPAAQERAVRARRAAHASPNVLLDVVTTCIGVLFTTGTYAGILLRIWPWMAVLLVLTAAPLALLQRGAARQTIRSSIAADRADRWTTYFFDSFSSPHAGRDIRLYAAGSYLSGLLRGTLEESRRLQMKAFVVNVNVQSWFIAVNALVAAGGTWAAARSVSSGTSSIGDFVLFITAVTMLQSKLSTTMTIFGSAAHSFRLVQDYQDVTAPTTTAVLHGTPAGNGPLAFEDVWFRYDEEAPWVLRGTSFSVQPGETVVVFGENGSGKSTLLALALRLFEPTHGRVTWAGVDVRDLDPVLFRERTTGVLQDFTQFELSVLDNILLASPQPGSKDRLQDLASRVCIADLIDALPHGWDTLLSRQRELEEGVAGVELSGGQRQRLALLRAMWRTDANLVVLDEATSALDHGAESLTLETIAGHFDKASKLIISHRPAAGLMAHQVLFLRDGQSEMIWKGSPSGFGLDDFERMWQRCGAAQSS